uniref:VWFA domain-containing protein n=1 Tax=Chromera velia CCMP2878 TaxID=1169474 RepID=A0A0G4HKY6_9ALVE|eukprot:Cvel_28570.t1-p1 / transcript=Cvel_28570.t1 / gene=Cvel_28570 / organism=Chromera_velia_CCMP2878 / gene_product=von Willebrand factor A domain-containing protein, putative / transcript_product=von Willebrand factor A domain-containing protein, putative / location=Cvel_scaffold3763:1186-5356(+) / protein_length=876 / sequence_SO=supercontig / SO=protein_coding / is_pseudo=false
MCYRPSVSGDETASHNFSFPVPLKSAHASVRMVDLVAQVTFTQTFQNFEVSDLAAKYVFPLPSNAVVSGFRAVLNNETVVEGRLEPRGQARKSYETALEEGDSTILLEEQRPDLFEIFVGRLMPGEEVRVEISYAFDVNYADRRARLILPTAVAPRYSPADHQLPSFVRDLAYSSESDSTGTQFSSNTATYSADVLIEMKAGQTLRALSSPSHPHLSPHATVTQDALAASISFPPQNLTHTATDFVLAVDLDPPKASRVVWEVAPDGQSVAAMLTVVPEFMAPKVKPEIVFVVDTSGSMYGKKIETARAALLLFLRSLPVDCFFNIVEFSSDFSTWSEKGSRRYDGESLMEAEKWVQQNIHAGGGTEFFRPLEFVAQMIPVEGYDRQVIFLTDGQVWDTDRILELVRKTTQNEGTRYFTVGIGSGASRELISRIALVGKGHEENVLDGEDPHLAVISQLERACHASVSDLQLHWPNIQCNATGLVASSASKESGIPEFVSAPSVLPAIYANKHTTLYALWRASPSLSVLSSPGFVASVRLSGTLGGSPFTLSAEMTPEGRQKDGLGLVHQLAAGAVLRDVQTYEDGEISRYSGWNSDPFDLPHEEREEAEALGVRCGIASEWTSWVATLEREGGNEQPSTLITRNVPQPGQYEYGFAYMSVDPDFARAASRKAYREQILKYHPDRAPSTSFFSSLLSFFSFLPSFPSFSLAPAATEYDGETGMDFHTEIEENAEGTESEESGLLAVVRLQKFDGSFAFADAKRIKSATGDQTMDIHRPEIMQTVREGVVGISGVLVSGSSDASLSSTMPDIGDIGATLAAIAWLEAEPVRASVSRLVVQKARSWVQGRLTAAGGDGSSSSVDVLLASVRESIAHWQ